jgi:electron transfer flavoprotein alpha subunit
MNALIIAEYDNEELHPATISAINAASNVADYITVLVIGVNCRAIAMEASLIQAVTKVLHVDHKNYTYLCAENVASVILTIIANNQNYYKYIICGATVFGKNILPRIAACLDVEQISEVTKIISQDTFERFIYSGDVIQTVKLLCDIKCLTVRVGYFENKLIKNINTAAPIEQLNVIINLSDQIKFLEFIKSNQKLELTNSKIVVAGGRGLQSKSNFALIEQLAYKLNAAIGATRTAINSGFAPNELQIGCSGKTIAPDLYIAIGISGAIQHLAGVKDSKIIVAINTDENAPIFSIANYKMVGDLFKIVPELIAAL